MKSLRIQQDRYRAILTSITSVIVAFVLRRLGDIENSIGVRCILVSLKIWRLLRKRSNDRVRVLECIHYRTGSDSIIPRMIDVLVSYTVCLLNSSTIL